MNYSEIVDFIRSRYETNGLIPLHEPRFLGNEKAYLLECIDSTMVSSVGNFVTNFEKQLAAYCGASYAVATVNGTAALHLSLLLAGVKRNELVITQAVSFIATCNAIAQLGAIPVFVDVDKDTLGMSPDCLEAFLKTKCEQKSDGFYYHKISTKKISACVPMHTFGHPCRIEEIASICTKYQLPLVEDAAESLGSRYKEKHTGTFGLMGTFSFNGNKIITAGGGGAIVTNDAQIAKHAKHLSTQAKIPHPWEFKHDSLGFNYRMPNLNAALACAQLEQITQFLKSKRILAEAYAAFFAPTPFTFQIEPQNSFSNYWLCTLLLENRKQRDEFLEFTNKNGIMTRPLWELLHRQAPFRHGFSENLEQSIKLENNLVCLPSSACI